jgi:predicted acylesterase/phospholipase RssA
LRTALRIQPKRNSKPRLHGREPRYAGEWVTLGGERLSENVDQKNDSTNDKVNTQEKADKEKGDKGKPKFDWVTERSSCSLPKVFAELRAQVEQDVKTRNGLRPNNSPYEFSVAVKGEDFTVIVTAKDLQRSVTFNLAEHAIVVRGDKGEEEMFHVTVTFSDDGKCKLYVNEQERDFWQVRRMALEALMFQ